MLLENSEDVTRATVKVMEQTHDPRLREIMTSLVRHLHGFINDVRLTEAEFRRATAIINEIGQLTNDTHNEAVLMAGSLGVSQLICLLNNGDAGEHKTSQNLLGPFWRMHSPATPNGGSILRSDTPGPPLIAEFRIVDVDGRAVEGAEVDIWHSSPAGFYESQDETQADMNLRGKFVTDRDGRIWFRSVRPKGYPIPTHGVVGRLLAAQGRHPFRPAHIHALVFKPGYKTLTSQIYLDDDPHLDSDVQFGVTKALTTTLVEHTEPHPDPAVPTPWYAMNHVLRLEPGEAILPRPPIR